jgi:hypothetical protein
MPDVQVSRNDVESLGDKIGGLESSLSDKEKALLLGVIAVASDSISSGSSPVVSRESGQDSPIAVDYQGSLPPLRDQFVSAFTPGATDAGGAAAPKVEGSLTIKISN